VSNDLVSVKPKFDNDKIGSYSLPMDRKGSAYHHGDLRAALLAAGEGVLAETGIEGFSLRAVAKRVGVSHAAPAHHFGDVQGLLTALAADGFRRFLAAMQARQSEAGPDPVDQLTASGLGYLDFAEASPALFRLMFASTRPKEETQDLAEAHQGAYGHLIDDIARLRGVSPYEDAAAMSDVVAVWSLVHGYSELVIAGRLKPVRALDKSGREAFFAGLLRRAIGAPAEPGQPARGGVQACGGASGDNT
jgi:AcrR family transcriptional regulator